MFRKSLALALALVLSAACSDDAATSNSPTGNASTTSPSTTGTPGPTTTGAGTTGVTSLTNAGPVTGTTSPSTTTGTSSTTGVGGATTGTVTSGDTGTPTGVGGTTSGDTTGTTTGGTTEMEWLPSWATSIQLTEDRNAPTENLAGTTLRQFVFPTYTGSQIRVQLSNEKGNTPVEISKVHIARAEPLGSGQIDASTDAEFTFEGSPSVTIPQGESVWSDPLDFELEEMQPMAVSMLFGSSVPSKGNITGHPGARTNSYIATGDAVSQASIGGAKYERWYFINAIEVMAPADAYAIAAFGDSITDGYGVHDQFARWPDYLTAAINEDPDLKDKISVLDFGNGGNLLLDSDGYMDAGIDRVERDILARPKVKRVIVLFGVNDILYGSISAGAQAKADDIIAGYQQIIDVCHDAGILVYGSPITPFGENDADATKNSVRSLVNTSVRGGGQFDEIIDFSATLLQAGSNPESIQAALNNDGLHPNTAGYEAMANTVDLNLLKTQ